MQWIFIILLLALRCHGGKVDNEFHEELFIKPLPSNSVYAYFQFTTLWDASLLKKTFDHCELFPRSLGELLGRYDVEELHVSLTKGLWRHEIWGYPFVEAPPGAEIYAWFNSDNIDSKWKGLCGGLSGLLCASLNFIDLENTMNPELSLSFDPHRNNSRLRYSTLPRETVCTENLTPWMKLLPCTHVGLASLLNSDHIYNTIYHSIGLHFRPIISEDKKHIKIELKQTVSLVYDLIVVGRAETHWSIQRFFLRGIHEPCPIAKSSFIYVDITSNQTGEEFIMRPNGYKMIETTRGGATTKLALFNLKEDNVPNIEVSYIKPQTFSVNIPPPLYAKRFITGYGQEFGGLTTKIYNKHWQPIKVTLLENIPWFVPVYYHTLKVTTDGKENKPLVKRYHVGKDRERPYCLELVIDLPPRSVTLVSIEMDYAFLKWQEYPPDANHGFYLGAAVISAYLPVARNYTSVPPHLSTIQSVLNVNGSSIDGYPIRITTEILILSLPTPDFSMPYNVICLACTVVALAFGPLHNITTKRFVVAKQEPVKRNVFKMMKDKLKANFSKMFKKKSKEPEEDVSVTLVKNEEETKKDR